MITAAEAGSNDDLDSRVAAVERAYRATLPADALLSLWRDAVGVCACASRARVHVCARAMHADETRTPNPDPDPGPQTRTLT